MTVAYNHHKWCFQSLYFLQVKNCLEEQWVPFLCCWRNFEKLANTTIFQTPSHVLFKSRINKYQVIFVQVFKLVDELDPILKLFRNTVAVPTSDMQITTIHPHSRNLQTYLPSLLYSLATLDMHFFLLYIFTILFTLLYIVYDLVETRGVEGCTKRHSWINHIRISFYHTTWTDRNLVWSAFWGLSNWFS